MAEWVFWIAAGVCAGCLVGGYLARHVGPRLYARKVRRLQTEIGKQVMASVILPESGFETVAGFTERYVEATGTVDTEDLEAVREWLEGVAERLREVGIKFVSQSYVAQSGKEIHWSIGASDPDSTRDELALMVGNAIEAAGGVPPP